MKPGTKVFNEMTKEVATLKTYPDPKGFVDVELTTGEVVKWLYAIIKVLGIVDQVTIYLSVIVDRVKGWFKRN